MPNNDYILRSDALKSILGVSIYDTIEELDGARTIAENTWADGLYDAYKIIEEEVDAADVEPKRKTGKWINHTKPDANNNVMCWCSECGAGDQHAVGVEVPYCWKCGAKMQDSTRGKHVGEMLDRIINQYMQKEEPHD